MIYGYIYCIVQLVVLINTEELSGEGNTNVVEHLPSYMNVTSYPNVQTLVTPANHSFTNVKANVQHKNISCLQNYKGFSVQVVNDTEFINYVVNNPNITSKDTPAACLLILFYSKYCPFSCLAAPYFNALPRAFPSLRMIAIDAMYHVFNVQNGVVGVPTLMLFHNGKPVVKYNESEYSLELYSKFISKHTGWEPEKSFVTSADFAGPVSSIPEKESNSVLYLAWTFIWICAAYYFSKTVYWSWFVESVQNIWRESEAQHQHEHGD